MEPSVILLIVVVALVWCGLGWIAAPVGLIGFGILLLRDWARGE